MIRQLVRTEIESSYGDLIFFASIFAILFLFFSFLALEPASDDAPDAIDVLRTIFMLAAFFASLVAGIRLTIRQTREKRIRLFSQLPVSTLQLSLASWYFRMLCVCIPTSAWVFYLILEDSSVAHYLQVVRLSIAFFLTLVTLIASISVALSIFNLPISRYRKWLYVILGVAVVVLVYVWLEPSVWDPVRQALVGQGAMLPVNAFLVLTSAGFVLADIWLRNRSDNTLG